MQFFVLRVASNKEDRVKDALQRKVKIEGVENTVGRILVPTERRRQIREGKRRDSEHKLYPGYVFIELELDKNGMIPENVWFTIKETDGVGDFIGSNASPRPCPPRTKPRCSRKPSAPTKPRPSRPNTRRATRSRSTTAPSRTSKAKSTKSSPTRAWFASSPPSSAAPPPSNSNTGKSKKFDPRICSPHVLRAGSSRVR